MRRTLGSLGFAGIIFGALSVSGLVTPASAAIDQVDDAPAVTVTPPRGGDGSTFTVTGDDCETSKRTMVVEVTVGAGATPRTRSVTPALADGSWSTTFVVDADVLPFTAIPVSARCAYLTDSEPETDFDYVGGVFEVAPETTLIVSPGEGRAGTTFEVFGRDCISPRGIGAVTVSAPGAGDATPAVVGDEGGWSVVMRVDAGATAGTVIPVSARCEFAVVETFRSRAAASVRGAGPVGITDFDYLPGSFTVIDAEAVAVDPVASSPDAAPTTAAPAVAVAENPTYTG